MRVRALAGGLATFVACGGNAVENNSQLAAPDADGGAGRDAGREASAGGTAGVISVDASLRDSALVDGRFPGCAPEETLPIDSEDGGAWCSVRLPQFAVLDPDLINVRFARKDGKTDDLYFIRSAAACDSDAEASAEGWYYYESAGTRRIGFCPAACALISIEGYGMVTVIKGCVNPRP